MSARHSYPRRVSTLIYIRAPLISAAARRKSPRRVRQRARSAPARYPRRGARPLLCASRASIDPRFRSTYRAVRARHSLAGDRIKFASAHGHTHTHTRGLLFSRRDTSTGKNHISSISPALYPPALPAPTLYLLVLAVKGVVVKAPSRARTRRLFALFLSLRFPPTAPRSFQRAAAPPLLSRTRTQQY